MDEHLAVSDSSFCLGLYLRAPWFLTFLAHRLHYLLVWCKVDEVEKVCLRKQVIPIGWCSLFPISLQVSGRCLRREQACQAGDWSLLLLRLRGLCGLCDLLTRLVLRAMDELASLAVWAVASLGILFAFLGFVLSRYVRLDHNLLSTMGKRTFVTVFALPVCFKVLAHLCSELVHVWSRWLECHVFVT